MKTIGFLMLILILVATVSTMAYVGQPKAESPATVIRPAGAAVPDSVLAEETKPAAVVKMTGWMKFDPAKVTVNVGDTVEWKNTSIVVHTVTCDTKKAADPKHVALPEGAEPFDSGNVSAGKTFTHTFTVAGTYKYFCIPHEKMGMVGEVEVKPVAVK